MMKNFQLSLLILFSFLCFEATSQITIWSENFNDYTDGTIQGSGTPPKWTINPVSATVWSVQSAQMQLTNSGNTEAVWTSEPINLNGYVEVSISVDIAEEGQMDGQSDYLNVYYNLDGGGEVAFETNGLNSDDFTSLTATQTGLNGLSVVIVMRIKNNNDDESHFFDNVLVQASGNLWTGNSDTDWNNTGNWSLSVIPAGTSNVVVPSIPSGGNFPETNSGPGALCNNLVVQPSAHLYIPSDNTLTVNGMVSNFAGADGLIIQSDLNGTGSLLHNTGAVDATVEQYLTANAWHYASSPISDPAANVFFGIYLKSFNESVYNWNPYIVDPATPLTIMLGYAAWVDGSNTTVSFSGSLNNGQQNIAVTADGPSGSDGWNLVGNPFPSSLDWDAPSGWTRQNIDNTIYYWQGVGGGLDYTGNYHYFVGGGFPPTPGTVGIGDGSRYIPPMQAFFIHASSNETFGVNNNARVHSNQAYWKSDPENVTPMIRLMVMDNEDLTDETVIRFFPGATVEHDGAWDAFKLDGYMVPQIYSITPEQVKLAISTLPEYQSGTVIPLGFVAPETGEYTIAITEIAEINTGFRFILEDLFFDSMHELDLESSYYFTASPQDDPNRFLLHFANPKMKLLPEAHEGRMIYAYGKSVYVQCDEIGSTEISVFNLMGQEVEHHSISEMEIIKINLNCKPGIYVVRTKSGSSISSEKVQIR